MAEASGQWTSQILCRYFMHGMCREGEHCNYSHDPSCKTQTPCKFYLKGHCSYGEKCRYDHVKPSKSNSRCSTPENSNIGKKVNVSNGPKPVILPSFASNEHLGNMITLRKTTNLSSEKGINQESLKSEKLRNPNDWVMAAEFVPGQKWTGLGPVTYLDAAQTGIEDLHITSQAKKDKRCEENELCPFAAHGVCRYGQNCAYLHGDMCELCGHFILHPFDEDQRTKHMEECMKKHEEDMELSFAVQRSSKKVCGICMDIIMEKKPTSERRFGILSNCNHVFCLGCIRKWRAAKQFENKIIRACPECRVKSDFVTPSKYWVEEKEEKIKLIQGYKGALGEKPCKYFDQGRGECPFNENCFYLHAYPDGRKASPQPIRRRKRHNAEGELDIIQQLILWDFLEEHRQRLAFEIDWGDDLDELLFHAVLWDSSSNDSDYSDVEDHF